MLNIIQCNYHKMYAVNLIYTANRFMLENFMQVTGFYINPECGIHIYLYIYTYIG